MEFIKINKVLLGSYYAVPDYQRDYEWTNAQNSTLADDVFSLIKNNDRHFVGAIVTIPFETSNGTTKSINFGEYSIEENNVKHLVDGQQRLTSLSIFIKALHDSIKEDTSIAESEKSINTQILNRLLTGDHYNQTNGFAPRLILNGNTGYFFNKYILEIGDFHCNRGYKGAKRIQAAFESYKKMISDKRVECLQSGICSNSLDFYKELIKAITEKTELVIIECPESSNAFQVFDSLNGKGLDLTAADRIKNIVMSWCPSGNGAQNWSAIENEIEEDYLSNFFVSLFFLYQKKRIAKNKLPDVFRDTFRTDAQNSFSQFFNKLRKNASIYGMLRKSRTNIREIDNILEDLKQLSFDQVYVMLFCAVSHYGEDICKEADFLEYVKSLTNLIVRMQVCDIGTNILDVQFARYLRIIDNGQPITEVTKEVNNDMNLLAPDSRFEEMFAYFNPTDSDTSEYYLRKIENYIRIEKSGNRTGVNRREATVEHIIPQTLTSEEVKEWYGDENIPDEIIDNFNKGVVESIGNKALLFGDDNSSASNKKYIDKINVYKNGMEGQTQGKPYETFELIKSLVDKYDTAFTHNHVRERAKELASYAVKIWK